MKGTPWAMTLDTCGTHVRVRRGGWGVLIVDRENTHRTVNGNIRGTTQAHRNDRGPAGPEGFRSGDADAGDDVRGGASAIVVHDFNAVEGSVLCNAEDTPSDCASDMGAI